MPLQRETWEEPHMIFLLFFFFTSGQSGAFTRGHRDQQEQAQHWLCTTAWELEAPLKLPSLLFLSFSLPQTGVYLDPMRNLLIIMEPFVIP